MVLSQSYYCPPWTSVQGGSCQVMVSASWGLLTASPVWNGQLRETEVAGKVFPVGHRYPSVWTELCEEEKRNTSPHWSLVHRTERKDKFGLFAHTISAGKILEYFLSREVFLNGNITFIVTGTSCKKIWGSSLSFFGKQ